MQPKAPAEGITKIEQIAELVDVLQREGMLDPQALHYLELAWERNKAPRDEDYIRSLHLNSHNKVQALKLIMDRLMLMSKFLTEVNPSLMNILPGDGDVRERITNFLQGRSHLLGEDPSAHSKRYMTQAATEGNKENFQALLAHAEGQVAELRASLTLLKTTYQQLIMDICKEKRTQYRGGGNEEMEALSRVQRLSEILFAETPGNDEGDVDYQVPSAPVINVARDQIRSVGLSITPGEGEGSPILLVGDGGEALPQRPVIPKRHRGTLDDPAFDMPTQYVQDLLAVPFPEGLQIEGVDHITPIQVKEVSFVRLKGRSRLEALLSTAQKVEKYAENIGGMLARGMHHPTLGYILDAIKAEKRPFESLNPFLSKFDRPEKVARKFRGTPVDGMEPEMRPGAVIPLVTATVTILSKDYTLKVGLVNGSGIMAVSFTGNGVNYTRRVTEL